MIELDRQLSSAPRGGGRQLAACIDAVLAMGVARVLDASATDRRTVRALARRSYVHPNGFEKITLARLPALGLAIRLHVWPENDAVARSDVHDHRWSFAAVLLRGSFERVTYTVGEGEPYAQLRYTRGESARSMRLVHHADVRVRAAARWRHEAGTFYVQRHDEVHRIDKPPGGRAISLFVSSAYASESCSVFKPIGEDYAAHELPPSRPISERALAARLRELAREIGPDLPALRPPIDLRAPSP